MSRLSPAIIATLAITAGSIGSAHAEGVQATILNTYSKVLVAGDNRGPNRIGNETGAGVMNPDFYYLDLKAQGEDAILIATGYTRSNATANNNNSYMQGGLILAKLTATGVEMGQPIDLPNLNGDRPFQRVVMAMSDDGKQIVAMAASEDTGAGNNNPRPVAFLLQREGLNATIVAVKNGRRGGNAATTTVTKPVSLMDMAVNQGINVPNVNNQRGPHQILRTGPNTFAVGMQYNNQAHEGFSFTINPDNTIKMNWVRRYSNQAQHCRPQLAFDPASNTLYSAAVEADLQPAEIGWRLVAIDPATGAAKPGLNKIVMRSQPGQNRYVSEPHIAMVDGKLAAMWGVVSKARAERNGNNGHAGGGQNAKLALFDPATLNVIDTPIDLAAAYSRHPGMFAMKYGPNDTPAFATIAGSSTGEGAGKMIVYPLTAEGKLGVKDYGKMYTISKYSDVANLSSRGNNNPNNQAKGFINGKGLLRNPGFGVANGFMPEIKTFNLSTVQGYSDDAAKLRGIKMSIWLSLVPATWKDMPTVPGVPTDKPGTGENGNGPLPTTPTTNPTNTDGNSTSGSADEDNVVAGPDLEGPSGRDPRLTGAQGGCSSSGQGGAAGFGGAALLGLGVVAMLRRRRSEEK